MLLTVGSDYTAISEQLSFEPGSTVSDQECFEFEPIEDTLVEGVEGIDLVASSEQDVNFADGGDMSSIVIEDDGQLTSHL